MSTNVFSAKKITRNWHLFDMQGKVLGRTATEIARLLIGKSKPEYVPYLDIGDNVVVVNASQVVVTGKKEQNKRYVRHSGYPGGLTVEKFYQVKETKPELIIKHAIAGMLPKTKIAAGMIKRLHIFPGSEHTFIKELQGVKSE